MVNIVYPDTISTGDSYFKPTGHTIFKTRGDTPMNRNVTEEDKQVGRRIWQLFEAAQSAGKIESQEQLAAAMGIPQSMLNDIFKGKKKCPDARIYKAAAIFRVSPQSIKADLADFSYTNHDDPINEALLEEVHTALVLALIEKGVSLEKVRGELFSRMVAKLYKKAQESNRLDSDLISYTVELLR